MVSRLAATSWCSSPDLLAVTRDLLGSRRRDRARNPPRRNVPLPRRPVEPGRPRERAPACACPVRRAMLALGTIALPRARLRTILILTVCETAAATKGASELLLRGFALPPPPGRACPPRAAAASTASQRARLRPYISRRSARATVAHPPLGRFGRGIRSAPDGACAMRSGDAGSSSVRSVDECAADLCEYR